MKNYSEMSDHQINFLVGKALDGHVDDKSPLPRRLQVFDPCNSWADGGPIIERYGIGLMPFKKTDAAAWDVSCGLLSAKKVNHEKPLRAAMIVFLMMQEGK